MNLMSNSLKFTTKGFISVSLYMSELSNEKKLKYSLAGREKFRRGSVGPLDSLESQIEQHKKLNIEIEDTGVGMKPRDLNKLFKTFGKLNDTHKINKNGTGLGLNITKRIVNSMDGEITVESEENKGTIFKIYVILAVKNMEELSNKRSKKLNSGSVNSLKFGLKNLN